MDIVSIRRQGSQWVFDAGPAGSGRADLLDKATRQAGEAVTAYNDERGVQGSAISWQFDDFTSEAMLISKDRARLKREADQLEIRTRQEVVRLSDEGIGMRDIATLLGISSAKVSQIRTPGQVYITDPDSDEINVVDIFTKRDGTVTRYGRGPLPKSIEFEGTVYVPTGGAHGANGGPMKYSYIPEGA